MKLDLCRDSDARFGHYILNFKFSQNAVVC